jgi:hypothetical protein
MSKTKHPNTYPMQFHELSQAALTNPSAFPLHIPFQTHAHAMTFRTRFYEFRRSLRVFAKTESGDPSLAGLQQLLAGAESLTSPRIDHNKPPVAILQLQEQVPYYEDSLLFISRALASAKQDPAIASQTQTSQGREPSSLEYHNFTTNRGNSYSIPSTDITDASIHNTSLLKTRVQLVESRLEKSSSFLLNDIQVYRTDNIKDSFKPSGTYTSGPAGQGSSIPEPTGYIDPDLA